MSQVSRDLRTACRREIEERDCKRGIDRGNHKHVK